MRAAKSFCFLILPAVMLLAVLMLARVASAATVTCPDGLTTVQYETERDFQVACEGVSLARSILGRLGLHTGVAVDVSVQPKVEIILENALRFRILGQYVAETHQIMVTDIENHRRMSETKPSLGVPFSQHVHRSLIVHEAAHAIAEANFRMAKPSRTAHEYIAYVTQMISLPEPVRAQVIAAANTEAFDTDESINELILAMKPDLFAVKAYLHFQQPGNGPAFIGRALSGSFKPDFWMWY